MIFKQQEVLKGTNNNGDEMTNLGTVNGVVFSSDEEKKHRRRNVFYIDANNPVVPGVIFVDYPIQENETDRRAQILVPGGYVKSHSHKQGDNLDGELLAPVGVTANNGKSIGRYNLSIEVAAADSPTALNSHSIEPTNRGWQYWLAVKKLNTPMPENNISNNWAGLDTPKGREAYWKAKGMTMDIANNGMVTLTDIQSGEKTTIEHNGREVTLRAYNGNGQALDHVVYDSRTQIATHYRIDGTKEQWNIKEILDKYQDEVPAKKKASSGHSAPSDPEL